MTAADEDSIEGSQARSGAESLHKSLEPLLASKKIVVFCGSGGVGKTSIAAASALAAAATMPGKVLVLTIDPAKRLADSLGLKEIGNIETRVPQTAFTAAGLEPRGELWAAMLDTKESWDALILRHASGPEAASRILQNRLYHNVTARFAQSHDYIAMERLFEVHESGRYDLIVIDTPPTRNALDFLDAPARMAEFFGGRLLRWLTLPYRVGGKRGARWLNYASKPFYQVADRLLGNQFLEDIAEFFLSFQEMYEAFVTRARAVERLLHDKRTTFAVVTTLEDGPLHEAELFCAELEKRNLHLGCLVINKVLPSYLLSHSGVQAADKLSFNAESVAERLAATCGSPFDDTARTIRVLTTIGESFRNFTVVARRESELRSHLGRHGEVLIEVPAFEVDIADIDGLARLAEFLLPIERTV